MFKYLLGCFNIFLIYNAGNPRVTPEVTRDVCLLARMMAANLYYSQIEDLMFEVFSFYHLTHSIELYLKDPFYRALFKGPILGRFLLMFPCSCPCGVAAMSFVFVQKNFIDPQGEMLNTT